MTMNQKNECLDLKNTICTKEAFWNINESSLIIPLSSSCLHSFFPKKVSLNVFAITTFMCHGFLPFCIKASFLPLPPQNLSYHVSGQCRPSNMYFMDPAIHGHSNIFPWCKLKWPSYEFNNQSHIFTRPWNNFIIHGVNNPQASC